MPALATLKRLPRKPPQSAIADGEAVVINESGQSDFSALESYVSSKSEDRLRTNLVFYAFDLLYLDATDLRR